MELYIIRHADAVPLGEGGISSDEERPLTERGIQQSHSIGKTFVAKRILPAKLFTSPLVRARQTAEGMLAAWPSSEAAPELLICEELAPGFKPRQLARFLRNFDQEVVALVGHEPDLSLWTAWLIGGKKAQLEFAKAGTAHVICPDRPAKGSGSLVFLVPPAWFKS